MATMSHQLKVFDMTLKIGQASIAYDFLLVYSTVRNNKNSQQKKYLIDLLALFLDINYFITDPIKFWMTPNGWLLLYIILCFTQEVFMVYVHIAKIANLLMKISWFIVHICLNLAQLFSYKIILNLQWNWQPLIKIVLSSIAVKWSKNSIHVN